MKAIVVETIKERATVLAEDGSYYDVRGEYGVGDEIDYRPRNYKALKSVTAIVAAFLVFFSGFTVYDQNYAVFATVTITEPALIEYGLNKKDEIIRVRALDKDADDIVEELKTQGIEKKVSVEKGIKKAKKVIREKRGKKSMVLTIDYGKGCPKKDKRRLKKTINRVASSDDDISVKTNNSPAKSKDSEQNANNQKPSVETDTQNKDNLGTDSSSQNVSAPSTSKPSDSSKASDTSITTEDTKVSDASKSTEDAKASEAGKTADEKNSNTDKSKSSDSSKKTDDGKSSETSETSNTSEETKTSDSTKTETIPKTDESTSDTTTDAGKSGEGNVSKKADDSASAELKEIV